jgi:hypothetical protein
MIYNFNSTEINSGRIVKSKVYEYSGKLIKKDIGISFKLHNKNDFNLSAKFNETLEKANDNEIDQNIEKLFNDDNSE